MTRVAESIDWYDLREVSTPDVDTIVLIYAPEADEPVWLGYHDGESWRAVDGVPVEATVTHYANLPLGPDAETRGGGA